MSDIDYALGYQAGEHDASVGNAPSSEHGPSSSYGRGYSEGYRARQNFLNGEET